MNTTLPDLPSALIRLAVADLRKAASSPKYLIDMGLWHSPRIGGKCAVCAAGAVMAFSMKVSPTVYINPGEYGEPIRAKLSAINEFRTGRVRLAFQRLGIWPDKLKNRKIVEYSDNPKKFTAQMLRMARELEKKGY